MAARAVADTNELLEMILAGLPMKEILCAKLVSRTWKELIETSTTLKIATFLAPSGTVSTPFNFEDDDAPYLQERLPLVSADRSAIINPVLVFQGDPGWAYEYRTLQGVGSIYEYHSFRFKFSDLARMDYRTFRDMYLSRPACTYMELEAYG